MNDLINDEYNSPATFLDSLDFFDRLSMNDIAKAYKSPHKD